MSTNVNRYGITGLSRYRKDEALPGEILVHKETGEILIKTLSGDVISYSHNSRIKNNIDITTLACNNINMFGQMALVEFDTLMYPEIVTQDVNVLSSTELISLPQGTKRVLISIDLDTIDINKEALSEFDADIEIQLTVNDTINKVLKRNVMEFKRSPIDLKELVPEYDGSLLESVNITKIIVKRNPEHLETDNLKFILNSIILVCEKFEGVV